ncbi:MAG: hypothetical protein ACF8PG_05220 [Maioricimonas sp. JB045]|uniref:hypothetical protein n=1 Tax=Maioricimonas sp. JC845 TaxID=3232138 RepID=UPI00345B385F
MSVAEPHETTDAEQPTVDQPTIEEEHQHHSYVSNAIPWYVRFIWLLFWIFVVYYGVTYFLPAIQVELLAPP